MINQHDVDLDQHYDPEFCKFAKYEIIQEYYPFIGEVISNFNSLENELNESLIDIINDEIDDIGWIVISDMSFSSKLKLWKKLLTYLLNGSDISTKDDLIKEIDSLSKEMTRLSEIRNKIAHANWEFLNEKLFVHSKTKVSDDNIKHVYLSVDKTKFIKIISEFETAFDRYTKFDQKMQKIY